MLAAGGWIAGPPEAFAFGRMAELYDPSTSTWSLVGSLAQRRVLPAATLLPDGRVLAVGGFGAERVNLTSAEIYDPSTNTWTSTAAAGP